MNSQKKGTFPSISKKKHIGFLYAFVYLTRVKGNPLEINGRDFTNFKEFGLSLWFDIINVNVKKVSIHE